MDSGLFLSGKRPPSAKSDDCPQASSFTGQATSEIDREVDWIEPLKKKLLPSDIIIYLFFCSQKSGFININL